MEEWVGPVRRGEVRCGATWHSAVQHGMVRCGAVRCGAVWCGAARCGAVRCGAARCGAVRITCCSVESPIHARVVAATSSSKAGRALRRAADTACSVGGLFCGDVARRGGSVNDILGQRVARGSEDVEPSPRRYHSRRFPTMVTRLVVDMFALSVALSAALLDPRQCRPQAPRGAAQALKFLFFHGSQRSSLP